MGLKNDKINLYFISYDIFNIYNIYILYVISKKIDYPCDLNLWPLNFFTIIFPFMKEIAKKVEFHFNVMVELID